MSMEKYKIIYADPPWSYNDKRRGFRDPGASEKYDTQSEDWIKNLHVKDIAEKDSVLFLWATSPLLPQAIETMKTWGFKFKTVAFVWVKKTKNGKQVHNLGRWTMGGAEIVLLGVKGKPKRLVKNIKQIVEAERTIHSRKPDEVRKRIVELMGDIPRIELFARERAPGWDAFGNEVESDIKL